jgi:hypothetical protein
MRVSGGLSAGVKTPSCQWVIVNFPVKAKPGIFGDEAGIFGQGSDEIRGDTLFAAAPILSWTVARIRSQAGRRFETFCEPSLQCRAGDSHRSMKPRRASGKDM